MQPHTGYIKTNELVPKCRTVLYLPLCPHAISLSSFQTFTWWRRHICPCETPLVRKCHSWPRQDGHHIQSARVEPQYETLPISFSPSEINTDRSDDRNISFLPFSDAKLQGTPTDWQMQWLDELKPMNYFCSSHVDNSIRRLRLSRQLFTVHFRHDMDTAATLWSNDCYFRSCLWNTCGPDGLHSLTHWWNESRSCCISSTQLKF